MELTVRLEPSSGRGREIFDVLERPNWAPWLRFSAEELDAQSEVFAAGQILVCDDDSMPLASLSTNRIAWDGNIDNLPTWDELAGESRTYAETFVSDGNTIVLMSVNVEPTVRGLRLTDVLVEEIQAQAALLGIRHLISDFRPSEFGQYKATTGAGRFETYCFLTRDDGLPVDHWLRSLTYKGMRPLRVDPRAMVVEEKIEAFETHKNSYRPDAWRQIIDVAVVAARLEEHDPCFTLAQVDEVWECGETGTWYIDRADRALYVESNLWGELPVRPHTRHR